MRLIGCLAMLFLLNACSKKTSCEEKLKENWACPAIYQPVCGCNNKTYSNACEAESHGITEYSTGQCK